jgi:hypothetical protein
MHSAARLAAFCLAGLLCVAPHPPQDAPPPGAALDPAAFGKSPITSWPDAEAGRLIFFAVLEGLFRDGVTNEVVDIVAPPPLGSLLPVEQMLFVPGCQICTPAQRAFALYRQRLDCGLKQWQPGGGLRDTFGDGLPEEVVARLRDPDKEVRLAALQALVTRWVAEHMDRQRLTPAEREDLGRWMQEAAKIGMSTLAQMRADDPAIGTDWKRCALCDGATGACEVVEEGAKGR